MTIELMKLPWPENALEPQVSARTISFHHGKHHRGYVNKLNDAIEGTGNAEKSLEDIIRASADSDEALFNNAAQVWNHNQYWLSMSPDGGGEPAGPLGEAIAASFGSFDNFKAQFTDACAGQFGSGWGWLVIDGDGRLAIRTTANAATPLTAGETVLLTCDVWEHAYYLDYQNDRGGYLDGWWSVVNWALASDRFGGSG